MLIFLKRIKRDFSLKKLFNWLEVRIGKNVLVSLDITTFNAHILKGNKKGFLFE
jgi:hypothetical protein